MDLAERVKQKLAEQKAKVKLDEPKGSLGDEPKGSLGDEPKGSLGDETLFNRISEELKEKIEPTDLDMQEHFNELAQTSDFKRLIYRGIVGKTFRGSNALLEKELNKLLKEVKGDN